MDIKEVITTGGLILIGVIALKAFGGVEGLAGMFKGVKDIFTGVGEAVETVTAPPAYIPPPDLPPDIEIPMPPPDWWEYMFPPLVLLPDEPQPIPPPPTISYIFPPWGLIDLLRPPPVAPPVAPSPPAYVPSDPVYYQPDPIVTPPDPHHPATDPWIGGR